MWAALFGRKGRSGSGSSSSSSSSKIEILLDTSVLTLSDSITRPIDEEDEYLVDASMRNKAISGKVKIKIPRNVPHADGLLITLVGKMSIDLAVTANSGGSMRSGRSGSSGKSGTNSIAGKALSAISGTGTYSRNKKETSRILIQEEQLLWRGPFLRAGTHEWPFTFPFPSHMPASVDTPRANITYTLRAFLYGRSREASLESPMKEVQVVRVREATRPPVETVSGTTEDGGFEWQATLCREVFIADEKPTVDVKFRLKPVKDRGSNEPPIRAVKCGLKEERTYL
ncbi:hypothetical protein HK102_006721 [Quaeritorhiza haematococci]|nr:hypothetical protein HK102_006721 [Quaeritorhiza haematococci]